jgi:hypothetical protein
MQLTGSTPGCAASPQRVNHWNFLLASTQARRLLLLLLPLPLRLLLRALLGLPRLRVLRHAQEHPLCGRGADRGTSLGAELLAVRVSGCLFMLRRRLPCVGVAFLAVP